MQKIKDHKLLGRELSVIKKKYLQVLSQTCLAVTALPSGIPLELILKELGLTPKEGIYCGSVSDCARGFFLPTAVDQYHFSSYKNAYAGGRRLFFCCCLVTGKEKANVT